MLGGESTFNNCYSLQISFETRALNIRQTSMFSTQALNVPHINTFSTQARQARGKDVGDDDDHGESKWSKRCGGATERTRGALIF